VTEEIERSLPEANSTAQASGLLLATCA